MFDSFLRGSITNARILEDHDKLIVFVMCADAVPLGARATYLTDPL
jgi:hypothetical protein